MINGLKSRDSSLVVQDLKSEILIYDLRVNKAFCLNETAAIVWRLCDGTNSVADISRKASLVSNSDISEDFVWLALDKFKQDDLLEASTDLKIDFKGLNRRQIIKKVGLSTMLALPTVATVIAPTAAQAASITCLSCYSGTSVPTVCLPGPSTQPNASACASYCLGICCIRSGSVVTGFSYNSATRVCVCTGVICA